VLAKVAFMPLSLSLGGRGNQDCINFLFSFSFLIQFRITRPNTPNDHEALSVRIFGATESTDVIGYVIQNIQYSSASNYEYHQPKLHHGEP
jgi:hypothetical protein